MKIAVINFSGNVGKFTIARHLLLPRIPGAEVITIESLNADECQGQGLGKLLLTDALDRVRRAAQVVGSAGVLVDAKDETVAGFYRSLGFLECQQDLSLFLPMESLGRP